MNKNKEELDVDTLYELVRISCELTLDGELYKIEGSTEDMVWLSSVACEDDYSCSYEGLLEDIKESDTPVEFFRLTKFASIM